MIVICSAQVHCSTALLLNSSGDAAEPTTAFCAFYKEGKGAGEPGFPGLTPETCGAHAQGCSGVWAFHILISVRIPGGEGCLVNMQALTQ